MPPRGLLTNENFPGCGFGRAVLEFKNEGNHCKIEAGSILNGLLEPS